MTERTPDSIAAVAREAVRLYFDPLSQLRAWLARVGTNEASDAYVPRRHVRRAEDRRSYSFAVAFGLVAVVTTIVAVGSMFRLNRAEHFLQYRGTTYAIDLQVRLGPSDDTFVITGKIHKPRASLASAVSTTEMLRELSTSRLVPIPFVRAHSLDGKWVALDPAIIGSDGTIEVPIPASLDCDTECQVAVLLLPNDSIRAGEQSLTLPPASAVSQILSVRTINDGLTSR